MTARQLTAIPWQPGSRAAISKSQEPLLLAQQKNNQDETDRSYGVGTTRQDPPVEAEAAQKPQQHRRVAHTEYCQSDLVTLYFYTRDSVIVGASHPNAPSRSLFEGVSMEQDMTGTSNPKP